jgi:hypothetical protein
MVFGAIGVLALIAPMPVLAAAPATTITMSVDPQVQDYADAFTLHATVTANAPADDGTQPRGTVVWYRYYSYPYYSSAIASETLAEGVTEVTHESQGMRLPPGENLLFARFTSDNTTYLGSTTPTYTVTVGPEPSTTTVSGPATTELHSAFTLIAQTQSGTDEPNGTISFYKVGNATALCTLPIRSQDQRECTVQATALGTFGYYAVYTGGPTVSGSTSNTFNVTVTADTVHARSIVTQYTTFYPVTDTYRDTVKVSGIRDELISGTVKFHSPAGTLFKTVSIASGIGAFSYTWNGRNSAGTIYPEGKYKIIVTLKDAFNTTKTVTSYVTLSKKRLIWHSGTVTKKGSSFTASGHYGGGTVAVNTTSGYVRLRAPLVYTDWAGAGWELTLPTAVSYKGITVRVYAKHAWIAGPATRLGSQSFTRCAYVATGEWSESCFDTWKDVGNSSGSLAWYSTSTLTSAHRSGTKVRLMVSCPGGTTYVYKARVAFQYATLGY